MSMTSNESLGFHARMSQLELRLKERYSKISNIYLKNMTNN